MPIGLECVSNFLNGLSLPTSHPCIIPQLDFIAKKDLHDENYAVKANRIIFCDICQMEIQGEKSWLAHLKGRKHRKILQFKKHLKEDFTTKISISNIVNK